MKDKKDLAWFYCPKCDSLIRDRIPYCTVCDTLEPATKLTDEKGLLTVAGVNSLFSLISYLKDKSHYPGE